MLLTQYCSVDKFEKNEMGEVCSAYGVRRGVYRVSVGKPEGKNHLGDPGVDGRIILRWIFMKRPVGIWTGSNWLRIRAGGGHL